MPGRWLRRRRQGPSGDRLSRTRDDAPRTWGEDPARLTDDLADLADVEVAPKMEGYQMFTIFIPKKAKVAGKETGRRADQEGREPEKKAEERESR